MLSIRQLHVRAGDFRLENLSLEIARGECVALMGSSGSGKTTLMEAVCGLRQAESGGIFLDGREITGLAPGARRIGYLPQDIALFPSVTVAEQIGFGPGLHGWKVSEKRDRVEELAEALGVSKLLGRKPQGLSGGEARRVALGRALALRPSLLCLDEALTGLDEELHAEILSVIRKMIARENVTVLHITHSSAEAGAIADRVLRMEDLIRAPSALAGNC